LSKVKIFPKAVVHIKNATLELASTFQIFFYGKGEPTLKKKKKNRNIIKSTKRHPGTREVYKKNAYLEREKRIRKSLKLITKWAKYAVIQV
jgi:hypothetical protein